MEPEEWEQVKRIFKSALDLNVSQRAGFLDAACGDRVGVRQTVEELLSAHQEASGFLDDASRQFPAVFRPGELVAERFRIIRLISRGGMGEVYETFDERLSLRLALKTLRPEFASDQDALERFRREIRVTRDFAHANLCRVYELVEHHLPPEPPETASRIITCLTMQLMSGDTLKQYLEKTGPLTPAAAFPLIKQIAAAISTLHANGIIHRDLKPSNIMIAPGTETELRAIVMDFGLAKPLTTEQELFESASDFHAGAPFFLAPELVAGEKPSIASDIYALGLIIDEMVTGGGAFSGDTVESILYQKLWGEPEDPQTRAPNLPGNWAAAIRRCLNRNPSARFVSGQDVVLTLTLSPVDTQRFPGYYRAQHALKRFGSRLRRPRPTLSVRNLLLVSGAVLLTGFALVESLISRQLDLSVLTFEFENLTGKSEYDYVCKGMTREVERRLLTIPGVKVLPYHDARPKDASIKTTAQFTIEGQLEAGRKSPRLSISIVEKSTGSLICCANSFENNLVDPLEMQGQIASAAVDAMRAAVLLPKSEESHGLLPTALLFLWRNSPFLSQREVGTVPTTSPVAMQMYMRAHVLWDQRTLGALRQAASLYQQAIQEDPKFALAYSDLAGVERTLLQYNSAPRNQLLQSARNHALQAVATGPGYAESYAALAVTSQYSWDWRVAEQNYKLSIGKNSKLAYVHRWYGGFLAVFGRFDESIKEIKTAIALDPYDLVGRLFLGTYLHYAGRPAEAATVVESFLAERDFTVGHNILGYVYAQLALRAKGAERTRLLDRALKETDLVAKEDSSDQKPEYAGPSIPMYSLIYALKGDNKQAIRYLNILLAGEKSGSVNPIDIACPYVALGDPKSALGVLKRAAEEKNNGMLYLNVDPFLEPLRNTAEFKALITQAGLN